MRRETGNEKRETGNGNENRLRKIEEEKKRKKNRETIGKKEKHGKPLKK